MGVDKGSKTIGHDGFDGSKSEVTVGESLQIPRNQLQRHLKNRQIQLIAIGGSIGTFIFVSIGGTLSKSGPASLLIAWTLYSCVIALVNNCVAEMTVYMPVGGGFIRMAGKWVDDAWGFLAGWNFFIYEALLVPFEITALTLVLSFWTDRIPAAAVCGVCIVLYGALNLLSVGVYGEAEFWLSGGKVVLLLIVFAFTFLTMVGANPQHDVYGFRYWNNPGAFAAYQSAGALGQFEGFFAALSNAIFAIVGPEYINLVAGESQHPRTYLKNAFKTIYWRFGLFFIGSALCVGIIVPYDDPTLLAILGGDTAGSGTAKASPYVIGMQNLGVDVLPHIVNALLLTSIFSAGNTYTYAAIRSLYGLALEGHAPVFLTRCTSSGVPIWCVGIVMLFPFLSFLQVSNSTGQVLTWLVSVITAGGAMNYIVITTTYIFFYRACKAQEIDRSAFPYRAYLQPFCGYFSLVFLVLLVGASGYASFAPWDTAGFVTSYAMVILAPVLFFFWKVIKKTKFVKPLEADLVWEKPMIDEYEASIEDSPTGFWQECIDMFRWRKAGGNDRSA
ncbi:hypothetical protein NW754_008104 [Fusarium falciforme]|uniref:Amino acid permease/ SLC12A domain-containing protein n=1 Tax=Fusarium falciforme TaxID=195108 RepID=A0A9W8R1J0_9HYPO|nr:hypothetical protein NW754_008104 [Fusarium falciforme]KAJ4182217.1 hypothetical protein NW755_010602 [Fusarium falciforme]